MYVFGLECVGVCIPFSGVRIDRYVEAKLPSVSVISFPHFFYHLSLFSSSLSLKLSFIYLNPTPIPGSPVASFEDVLSWTDEKFKASDGSFQQLMKGKRNLPLCVSQMDVGIVAVAWVAGTGTIGKTSVQSLLQSLSPGSHTSWLIWHAWKWANAQERQRKPHPAEPLSYLWQNRNQKCIIQMYLARLHSKGLFSPCPGTIHWHKAWALSVLFFSQSDAKLINVFRYPEESWSLKHITTPVIWRPTCRHTIHFC